jgi:3-oxoacyl-[acyl-carrier protein] reductase
MKLKGKCAIITGGGRGLGRAAAIAMAREGAAVVVISRTTGEVNETAATIMASGGRALPLVGDISNPQLIRKLAESALDVFGSIDIVLNNAAVVGPFKPLWQVEPEEWRNRIDINLMAPQMMCRAVVPQMVRQGSGKIINVTSGLGDRVMSPFGVYSVSKAGLNHLTRILAEELREYNIQVNGLNPGVIETRMQEEIRRAGPEQLGEQVFRNFQGMKEQGMLVPPEQVAQLALFLASPESDGVTGEIGSASDFARFGYKGK